MCKLNDDVTSLKMVVTTTSICRDEDGFFLGASARVIEGINDPMTLEA
jgi:hypothetical protein